MFRVCLVLVVVCMVGLFMRAAVLRGWPAKACSEAVMQRLHWPSGAAPMFHLEAVLQERLRVN